MVQFHACFLLLIGVKAEVVEEIFLKNQDGNFLAIVGPSSMTDFEMNGELDHENCDTLHYELKADYPCNFTGPHDTPTIFRYNRESGQIKPKFVGSVIQEHNEKYIDFVKRIYPGGECNLTRVHHFTNTTDWSKYCAFMPQFSHLTVYTKKFKASKRSFLDM